MKAVLLISYPWPSISNIQLPLRTLHYLGMIFGDNKLFQILAVVLSLFPLKDIRAKFIVYLSDM